jgi:hypothetical protein
MFMLMLSVSLVAQQRTGNIYGKVVDPEDNPLPGVTVTLIQPGGAPMTAITSSEGLFRFLSLPPSRNYGLKLELAGFKARIEEDIVVTIYNNTNLTLKMEVGVIEEQVTVTAVSPMVDQKKTSVGTNVTQEILQELPTARDPWVILQMAPSVIMDRENIGGAESGQQSTYVSRGSTTYSNNVWAMDGIVITDPAAIGASPSYYDFDAFEEMQITVGGSDVTVQTGGIALNMVTRRGGNRLTFGGRFYFIDEKFQADNFKPEFAEQGALGVNKIRNNKDYGFNIGLPLIRDKAWFWASYGVSDIKTTTVYDKPDDTLLQNYVGKLNIQIVPQNRFEAFAHIGGKIKYGRSSSASNPEGLYQQGRYHFGSPITKLQDEHMFGDNLFISLKYAFSDAGFSLTPMTDLDFDKQAVWDVTDQRYYGSQASRYYVERPVNQYNFLANYFNDMLFGASHDVKIGFEYAGRIQYVESVWSGNYRLYRRYNTPQIDLTGDGAPDVPTSDWYYINGPDRGYYRDQKVDAYAGFLQDTISLGRINILLGLRYDYQAPSLNPLDVLAVDESSGSWKDNFTADTITKINALLPGVPLSQTSAVDINGNKYAWKAWSPRLGITWDVTGDGKTLAKASFGMYGDFMGTGMADRWLPGGASGSIRFWWKDNGDGKIDWSELYWLYRRGAGTNYAPYPAFDASGNFIGNWTDASGYYWTNYDYQDPVKLTAPYAQTRADSGTSRTTEAMITLEREISTDFGVSIIGTYRKYDHFNWSLKYFPDTGVLQNQSWYISAGSPPSTLTGLGSTQEAANHDWYYTSAEGTAYSPYSIYERMPSDRYNDYWGFDFVLNKRLSNKWMANVSLTYQTQAAHYGTQGYMSPTNIWAYEGQDSSAYIGSASGLLNQYTNARWLVKLSGLYQFPWDINASFTFQAREGWLIDEYFAYYDYTLPNPQSVSANLEMVPFGSNRLDPLVNIGLRLEKMLRLGDTGRIYIMGDLFNVLNADTIIRRQQKNHGSYYHYAGGVGDRWVPWVNYYNIDGTLNPRVARVGVRFTF